MLNIIKKNYVLILYDYKKLSLRIKKFPINKFLFKDKS